MVRAAVTRTCEICEQAPATLESILFPSELAKLFAMFEVHRGDHETWPSLSVCEPCAEACAPVMAALASLPADELVHVTSGMLRIGCRFALEAIGAEEEA